MHPWPDLVVAVVLAFVFAAVADLLRVGSRIRELWRWLKDKNAEGSIASINQRIAQQEKYRNTLRAYLASDKTLYLAMLQSIVGILLFICIAGILLIFGGLKLIEFPVAELAAFGAIAVAIVAGLYTMQLGSFDASKIAELIGKLDAEILALEEARDKLMRSRK